MEDGMSMCLIGMSVCLIGMSVCLIGMSMCLIGMSVCLIGMSVCLIVHLRVRWYVIQGLECCVPALVFKHQPHPQVRLARVVESSERHLQARL